MSSQLPFKSPSRQHRKTLSSGSVSGNTIRRLSDDDVRAIFECLHHQGPLPSRLHFAIVPVGSNGLKLSPPSYEFESMSPVYICVNLLGKILLTFTSIL